MNAMTNHERPGVYSSYEVSSLVSAAADGRAVAVVAQAGEHTGVFHWTGSTRAVADVGICALSKLAQIALKNGAGLVYGVCAGSDYSAAFDQAAALEDVAVVMCDSTDLAVQQAMLGMVEECSGQKKERIAVAFGKEDESVEELIARAAKLNHERMVLVAPGDAGSAAAVAGAIAGNADPALPLGGAELLGISGVSTQYEEGDIDALIRGGVTPLEMSGGAVSVVRAVTTRTTTGGASDTTWRELATILVVDEVIPSLRSALRARFARAKNTPQTRGAIRSQVVLELENRVKREVIDRYGDVTVEPLESDPTVCVVEFAFAVTHGLNQIWLSAYITV